MNTELVYILCSQYLYCEGSFYPADGVIIEGVFHSLEAAKAYVDKLIQNGDMFARAIEIHVYDMLKNERIDIITQETAWSDELEKDGE